MITTTIDHQMILRDLGGGLVLRQARPDDQQALASFNAMIHSDFGPENPDSYVEAWTRDLFSSAHPTFRPTDITIVEDTATRKIVSSMNLISQTWTYAGIPFGVGRPELVGTLPEYRNRGLVRAQFEVAHQWSAERGEKIQAITGIPYYYRLFGYEMTMNLGGGRAGFLSSIPKRPALKDGEVEPYWVRPVLEKDLPFIEEIYNFASRRQLVSCLRDAAMWRYEWNGKSKDSDARYELRLIENASGEPVGFLAHPDFRWGSLMVATCYELKAGISWAEVTPIVLRYMQATGEALGPKHDQEPFNSFGFLLGSEHPVYELLLDHLPRERRPYAWYVRVPDLPGFLTLLAPALEERLANSLFVGHSGELKITFYRDGLRMVFEKGRLTGIESWMPAPVGHAGDAAFPGLTFLQLLFGYRSLSELKYAFADCWTSDPIQHSLLSSLFPKQASNVWPIS